ncbi:autotransporter-associated beta strand repeat-containing protein [Luteolibacter ambystomatis]|uniref:Autotransporter-associated beta strand repeat-containing protein n=1 Tax=Luteolibacter ambystomatis TaxID=2824561 RepID=A0A975IZZ9_9BACT|nr:autotransporter-associated beta strand repeat-containing protein [Luteolibacter ambystomatis]QUE51015.1 autotransporter-associated beta strand repeat-containing protein [Luteolibacter ambystomatis]
MKPHFLALPLLILLGSVSSRAASGTWSSDTAGDWSDTTKWTGGIMADGADATATFTTDITADRIINLDTARTLGNLTFGDAATATAASWTLSGTNTLTFQTSTGTPTITLNALGTAKPAIISAPIAGTQGLNLTSAGGNGTVTLAAANTYSGTTTIASAANGASVVNVTNAQAFGTSAVKVNGSNQFSSAVAVAAGLNITNALTLKPVNSGSGRALVSLGSGATWSGSITLDNTTAATTGFPAILNGGTSAATASTVAGNITCLPGTNTNALVLRNSNTYGNITGSINLGTGTLQILDSTKWQFSNTSNTWGVLTIDHNSAIIYVGAANTLSPTGIIAASTGVSSTLRLNNMAGTQSYNQSIAGLKDTGTGKVNVAASQAVALTLNTPADVSGSGIISGPISIIKTGTAKQTLAGANTYTGNTTVNQGSLSLTSAYLADASKVFLAASGAVLNLNYSGSDTITELYIDGILQVAGTWGSSTSGAAHVDDAHFSGSGTLTVTSGAASGYDGWATSKGLTSGNSAKDQDADGDGMNNLMEFAFDRNPLSGAGDGKSLVRIATVGSERVLVLTTPVRSSAIFPSAGNLGELVSSTVDGITYHIQAGTDLASFPFNVDQVTGTNIGTLHDNLPALTGGWSYRSFYVPGSDPAGNAKIFIRAKVTE